MFIVQLENITIGNITNIVEEVLSITLVQNFQIISSKKKFYTKTIM